MPVASWRLATRNRRRFGGYTVHLGVLVIAVAIALSRAFASETMVTLQAGEAVSFGGYRLTYERLVVEPLPDNPAVSETRAEITYAGPSTGQLQPALRDYPSSQQAIATPAVNSTLTHDLYLTLMAYDRRSNEVTLRLFLNPAVAWIWIGGAIIGLGTVFAMWPDRRRQRQLVATPRAASIGTIDRRAPSEDMGAR